MRKPFAILFLSFIPLICTAASEPAHIPIAADAVPYSEPLQNITAGAREFFRLRAGRQSYAAKTSE